VNVLQVLVRFFPYVGGVEKTAYELSRRLVQRGHRVQVVCAAEPDGPAEVEGIAVERLRYYGKVGNANLCFGLRRALRRYRPDVIHTHIPTVLFPDAAAAMSEATGTPCVVSYNNDIFGRGAKGWLAALYNRIFLPRLFSRSARVVVSNPRYPLHSPFLGLAADRTMHIPWGVDLARLPSSPLPAGRPLVMSFLSLLDAQHSYKGLEDLLRALAVLKIAGHDFQLRVGGAGEKLGYYRGLATSLGLGDHVEFLGFVPDEELLSLFADSHLFVLPSRDGRQEGFGLVVLEAMAVGRPVLTTTVVGMAEDLERCLAGRLVAPRDVEALTAALERFLSGGIDMDAMGRRGRQLVEDRYDWEYVTDRYEALYEELVAG